MATALAAENDPTPAMTATTEARSPISAESEKLASAYTLKSDAESSYTGKRSINELQDGYRLLPNYCRYHHLYH